MKLASHSRVATAAVLLAATATVHAALPGGLSGTWYNPSQSGHGISLEVISTDRAIALWHVFDKQGNPLTLYVDGRIDGRQIHGPAYAPNGMRFGDFDPSALQLPVWGEIAINIESCDSARLSWSARDSNFGNGEIGLSRLSGAEGLGCELSPAYDQLPVGLYNGQNTSQTNPSPTWLNGIVDREGRLWGYEYAKGAERIPVQIPGPSWVGAYVPSVVEAVPQRVDGGNIEIRSAHRLGSGLSFGYAAAYAETGSGQWADTNGNFVPRPGTYIFEPQSWRAGPAPGVQLLTGIDGGLLAGQYRVPLRAQFFDTFGSLEINADGSACYRYPESIEPSDCWLAGKITTPEGAIGLIDFDLKNLRNPALSDFRGRGWLQDTSTGRQLILIGDNGTTGLLLIGTSN